MGVKKIKKSKYKLSPAEQKACHGIIHSASVSTAAVGAGLAQLPLADNAVITPIQITMIVSLGKVFDQEITKTAAKGILAGLIASFVGRGVSQAVWGWIPGIGNASNAITAAAITESIGWLGVDHFYKEKYLRNATSNETSTEKNESTMSEADIQESKQEREELRKRAEEFIRGEKTLTGNKSEYMDLLNDFEHMLIRLDKSDELYKCHEELLKLRYNG